MKSLYTSKTFWLATTQAIIGMIAVFASAYPDVGALMVAKSFFDILLRIETATAIVPSAQVISTTEELG